MWQIPAGWKWQKIEGGSPQRGTLLPKRWSWFGCVESHSSHWSSVWSLQRSAWNKTRKHIQIQICVRQAENNTRYTSLPHVWALWRLMIVQTRASKKKTSATSCKTRTFVQFHSVRTVHPNERCNSNSTIVPTRISLNWSAMVNPFKPLFALNRSTSLLAV